MSPLGIVGIFTLLAASPARCDVKHVLEGSAHPPAQNADPRAINFLANSLNSVSYSSSEESSDRSLESQTEFWWMKKDSPLKQANEYYKKCSLKGNCITPVADINRLKESDEHDSKIKIDLSSNPFLNGGVKVNPSTRFHEEKIDFSTNPFFNGKINMEGNVLHSGNGEAIDKGVGFIGVQPVQPFSACKQAGYVCVERSLCHNGVVKPEDVQFRNQVTECNKKTEVCCRLPEGSKKVSSSGFEPAGFGNINGGKSSVLDSLAKQIGSSASELNPSISFIGETGNFGGPSTSKPIRATSISPNGFFGQSTIDYSNVDFDSAVRFASTIKGPAYLPPEPTTTPTPIPSCGHGQQYINGRCQCQFGQVFVNGRCQIPEPPKPTCNYGQILINGICQCPSGQVLLNGRCQIPEPPKPRCRFDQELINGECVCPSGQILINGRCQIKVPPQPTCNYGQILINGICQCPSGQVLLNGRCQIPEPPKPTCLYGQSLINGVCSCPSGQTLINNRCQIRVPPQPTCNYGQILINGICQCPSGQVLINGRCQVPAPPKPTCYNGQILVNDVCQCPSGQKFINGRCQVPQPPKPECALGQQYINGRCQCPSGQTLVNGRCQIQCAFGEQLVNGVCQKSCNFGETLVDGICQGYLPPKPTTTEKTPEGEGSSINQQFQPPPKNNTDKPSLPVGCAAALKCVQEIYCTAEGFISPVPVVLTKEQERLRAPTTECLDEDKKIGKCCRDPNYQDPWPSANLVNGVDNGQYREDPTLGQYFPQKSRPVRGGLKASASQQVSAQALPEPSAGQCGQRHLGTSPLGPGPIDANFAEFPWQAMILRDSNRSLLCGGAIIRRDAVLTSAHCVEGLDTKDVLIKGGEWKLGIDEEPLPFQIVKVKVIVRHPDYKHGSNQNDLALLILEEKLRLAKNIGTICLPKADEIPTQNCLATGWGKTILQLHLKNALMHAIDISILDPNQCKQTLTTKYQHVLPHYNSNTICGFSKIDQCQVDYGSALACKGPDGSYTLSGIFSWDTGCKDEGQIGGYVAPDVAWIDSCLSKPHKELRKLEREYLAGRQ